MFLAKKQLTPLNFKPIMRSILMSRFGSGMLKNKSFSHVLVIRRQNHGFLCFNNNKEICDAYN